MVRKVSLVGLALVVSACSTGVAPRAPVSSAGSTLAAQTARPAPAPAPSTGPGNAAPLGDSLNGVLGSPAAALTQRFGPARIDLQEGDARKLQFRGSACVLDIFLYPLAAGAEPVATHVAARLRSDGSAIDRNACISEVETQSGGG